MELDWVDLVEVSNWPCSTRIKPLRLVELVKGFLVILQSQWFKRLWHINKQTFRLRIV